LLFSAFPPSRSAYVFFCFFSFIFGIVLHEIIQTLGLECLPLSLPPPTKSHRLKYISLHCSRLYQRWQVNDPHGVVAISAGWAGRRVNPKINTCREDGKQACLCGLYIIKAFEKKKQFNAQ
jgi:hypothetical protein